MNKWRLKQTQQCETCPWIVGNTVDNIPSYERGLHERLQETIATPGELNADPLRIMACHYSQDGDERHCLGWLMNQLGAGNNIGMRIRMISCQNTGDIVLRGEQHSSLSETFQ